VEYYNQPGKGSGIEGSSEKKMPLFSTVFSAQKRLFGFPRSPQNGSQSQENLNIRYDAIQKKADLWNEDALRVVSQRFNQS
jgi:hypothetical protein